MVHTASVIPAAMPGVTVATAWAIQQSDFTETLEANCLLPGPISREGISALRHTYCRTPSPDDRAKRRTPCVFIHAIEGHHRKIEAGIGEFQSEEIFPAQCGRARLRRLGDPRGFRGTA